MKALFVDRRMWVTAFVSMACVVLDGCTNPKPHPAPAPSPTPSHSKHKKPKPNTPAATPTPRFSKDPAGDQLQKLISSPQGQAKLRAWMNANGLQNEAVEIFIRADIYAAQRKTAASALIR
jgi:hypothetical protein